MLTQGKRALVCIINSLQMHIWHTSVQNSATPRRNATVTTVKYFKSPRLKSREKRFHPPLVNKHIAMTFYDTHRKKREKKQNSFGKSNRCNCTELECNVSICLMLNGYYVISSVAHKRYHIMVNGDLFSLHAYYLRINQRLS